MYTNDQRVHDLLAEIYRAATVVRNGEYWTTINSFTDYTDSLRPELLLQIAWSMARRIPPRTAIILGEEEKGAALATTLSLVTGIPLVLARYYTYPIEQVCPTSLVADIKHEYYAGKLVVNGLRANQTITIIEDTVSTGGTIRALAALCRKAAANVVAVITAVEKVNYGGRNVVREHLGIELAAILRISVESSGAQIVSAKPWMNVST